MRFPIFLVIMFVVAPVSGCAKYAQVQIDLLQQSRHAVQLTRTSLDEKSKLAGAYHSLQRQRLDEAFDEDVRNRLDLTSDWVIEHRRAYAAALDAIASARAASVAADQTTKQNLDAMDEALQRVIWLQSVQAKVITLFKEPRP